MRQLVQYYASNKLEYKGAKNMKTAAIQLGTLTCPSCVQKIESALKSLDGVEKDSVKVLFNSSKAKFNFDDTKLTIEQLENAITVLGYDVKKSQIKNR